MARTLVVVLVAAIGLTIGCGASQEQLVRRASFDLNCPEAQVTVYEIDGRTRGVRGCARQATYVESCEANRSNCTWVLNSDANAGGENRAPAP